MTPSSTTRVFIVTGGTGALGQAVVSRLLATGANVVVTYQAKDELNALTDRLSAEDRQRFTPFHVDVTSYKEVSEFVQHVVNQYNRIDGLANLVGGYTEKPFVESTPEEWQKMLNLNLTSTIFVTRAVLPVMVGAGYGRIVSVGSRGAIQALPNAAAYNVAKVGVMWLMETISNEVRGRNITANTVLPSVIDTAANRAAMPHTDTSRWVRPDEVAELIAYLLSDVSSGTSGAKIPVYGKA